MKKTKKHESDTSDFFMTKLLKISILMKKDWTSHRKGEQTLLFLIQMNFICLL